MTPISALAVIGAIASFVFVVRTALHFIESVIEQRKARRAMRRFGILNHPDEQSKCPGWAGFVAALVIIYAAFALAMAAVADADCGEERAAVKLGLDRDARAVPLHPVDVTIAELVLRPAPRHPGAARVQDEHATERTVWRLTATVTGYKAEQDGDYHVVVADEHGQTMIVEIPDPACAATGAWSEQILAARTAFRRLLADARLPSPTKKLHAAHVDVVVTGVGFFDKIHGQDGVARNGVELHPVMSVESGGKK